MKELPNYYKEIFEELLQKKPVRKDGQLYGVRYFKKSKKLYSIPRLKMQLHLNKLFGRLDRVFHINGDVLDNRIENLKVYSKNKNID